MIPKVIHYCWFGGKPLPDLAKKCITSWKKYFPGYEIREWNENNFDLNCCNYVKEAYTAKKWAFVSDYARFWILYNYGGLYFDTDVEVIKSFDDILAEGGFMGQEAGVSSGVSPTSNEGGSWESATVANPGLGIAVAPGLRLYKEFLDFYNKIHFIKDGVIDTTTICVYVTNILKKYGYDNYKEEIQKVAGIIIYPPEYFCPQNCVTGEIKITENTHSIHHYAASWHTVWEEKILQIERCKNKSGIEYKIRRAVSFPFRVISKIDRMGWKKTVRFVVKKISEKCEKIQSI